MRAPAAPGALRSGLRRASALLPPLGWQLAFFAVPIGILVAYSLGVLAFPPGSTSFSWSGWGELFSGSSYLELFGTSAWVAFVTATACVVLAYPIAYTLAFVVQRRKHVLLLLILMPFFTSFLLRVFAWKVILGDNGVLNSFAYWTGLRADGDPVPALLYSRLTVIIVLVYAWVPFVALPIFVALETLDRRLLEAAADLGASRLQTFRLVTLPMSMVGVLAAFTFVFVPSLGEFVVPLLVGGTKGYMYGNAISDAFNVQLDWQLGAVLAVFLIAVTFCLVVLTRRALIAHRGSALDQGIAP